MDNCSVVIKGKTKKNKIASVLRVAGIILSLLSIPAAYSIFQDFSSYYQPFRITDFRMIIQLVIPHWIEYHAEFVGFYICEFFSFYYGCLLLLGILSIVGASVLRYYTEQCEIIITESCVCGKIARGKNVEIPLNQITAIHKCSFIGISVSSLLGIYNFYLIENHEKVIRELSHLLTSPESSCNAKDKSIEEDKIEKLKALNELLVEGVLTQEEFDSKKKKLLGL